MRPHDRLSLLDVIENLNTIVEANSLEDIEVTETSLFIPHHDDSGYWTPAGYNDETMEAIKVTFKSAYQYIHSFYRKIQEKGEDKSLIDGINTIIVLIGEAKKKLEKLDKIFANNISQLPEYKDIETFYRSRIIKEVKNEEVEIPDLFTKGTDDEWDKDFEKLFGEVEKEQHDVRLLNNIEEVKRDHLYELFYLKDINGHNFYSDELARNIKLACDFGQFSEDKFTNDPLIQMKYLLDKNFQLLASKMIKALKRELELFYKNAFIQKEVELVMHLHNAAMALMLASNPKNILNKFHAKGCESYFRDFQIFLREALNDREYQKFSLYASSTLQEKSFFQDIVHLIYGFCYQLFTQNYESKDLIEKIEEFAKTDKEEQLSKLMESSFRNIQQTLKQHPSGPVFKALDLIREEERPAFDPIMMGNITQINGHLQSDGRTIPIYRSASPTKQDYVHLAEITEEFKTFLFAMSEKREHEHYLIFNLQDRTSWREHARVHVLEELSRNALFSDVLSVITLAKDTDFYLQIGTYQNLSNAQEFMDQFLEHLEDESTGYYFPSSLKEKIFKGFARTLLESIHREVFNDKKILSMHERLDFIELTYLLLELKIIELVQPTKISHLSKDGLDTVSTTIAGLMALLKKEDFSDKLWNNMLFSPTLIQRERIIHLERFERLLSLTILLENKDLSNISHLFAKETWQIKAVL